MSCTIAVDAFGGDFAPLEVVKGAVQAARMYPETKLLLVGQQSKIIEILENDCQCHDWQSRFTLVDAPDVIGMDESPIKALREKKKSSVSIAIDQVKKGIADGVVSLGNTGVVVAASTLKLRNLPQVHRAAIAVALPTFGGGPCLVLDMGANVNCDSENFRQYSVMGSIYSREIFGVDQPRVGLLNIGEETAKGNDLVKEAYGILEQQPINFIGNVEGRDIYQGACDVLICDGFVGNVVLKTSEGLVKGIMSELKKEMMSSVRTKIGAAMAMPAFKALKAKTDYTEYGGAVLLGVNGVVIVGHGSSNAHAACNAIRVAIESVEHNVNQKIVSALEEIDAAQASSSQPSEANHE